MTATSTSVKEKLRIHESDTSKDAQVALSLAAARARLLSLAGYAQSAGTVVDTLRNVQLGRELQLSKRPVSAITQARVRGNAQTPSWATVLHDLVDPAGGRVVLVSVDSGLTLPQLESEESPYFKWRRPRYAVAEITYTVSAASPGEDFDQAAEALAVYWYQTGMSGALASSGGGGVQESYREWPVPPWVSAVIAAHTPQQGGWL